MVGLGATHHHIKGAEMTAIVVHLRRWEQRRLVRLMRTTREAGIRTRALIVLHAAGGKSTAHC